MATPPPPHEKATECDVERGPGGIGWISETKMIRPDVELGGHHQKFSLTHISLKTEYQFFREDKTIEHKPGFQLNGDRLIFSLRLRGGSSRGQSRENHRDNRNSHRSLLLLFSEQRISVLRIRIFFCSAGERVIVISFDGYAVPAQIEKASNA